MKAMFVVCFGVAVIGAAPASAQGLADPMDMSLAESQTSEDGLVSVAEVESIRENVNRLLAEGDCAEALDVLPQLADRSNRLANLVRRGLEPYYSASSDERRLVRTTDELAQKERLSGQMIELRNRAWVDEAQCHIENGDNELAAARLFHALDLITVSERETWEQARNALWQLIGAVE